MNTIKLEAITSKSRNIDQKPNNIDNKLGFILEAYGKDRIRGFWDMLLNS